MFTDLPVELLRKHRTSVEVPEDLDDFWSARLTEARALAEPPEATEVDTGLTAIRTWDVRFSGWGGQRIAGWLRAPAAAEEPLPAIVEYVGYGGGRGAALDNLAFAAAGYAHLMMDTRGQGSGWSAGITPDSGGTGPEVPGVMTRGIDDPAQYYYTRFFTDAVLAVDAVRALPGVDGSRVGVTGGSQGGAGALAAGALAEDVRAVAARVPFLCDIPRSMTITDARPFHELVDYLAVHRDRADHVLGVLARIDGAVLASRITAPLVISAALMDAIVPPSGPFAAFNAAPSERKEILVHPYNGHEGGGAEDIAAALRLFAAELRR
ncbi:acetylxylan esterase [Amnibacterium sp.]|uniref:acetylxylan esterase n=1 Tax=Amnibacterium sp. TaxID=1872496 RepID=UPI003F7B5459